MNPFKIEDETKYSSLQFSLIFITVAYIFSILVRMIWVWQFHDMSQFIWHDELMINTNDGYYFASAVQNILFGTHTDNPQIPIAIKSYPGVIYATVLFTKILPVSLETVILYMPAFISSLVVIPIILIARLFNMQFFGFLSALLGAIAWSYYNRTMVGYYDSDMFSVLFQMVVLYAFIALLVEHKFSNIIFAFLAISIYPFFYPQGMSLIYAMYGIYILYVLYSYRNDSASYISIAVIAIALMPIGLFFKVVLGGIFLGIQKTNRLKFQYIVILSFLTFLLFMFNANVFDLILNKLNIYTSRGTEDHGLEFYQVIQTVREAGKIPFSVMANRISGSSIGVIAALIGYLLLVIRYRQFLIALPLIAIGIFSLWGGLRFTVYAVGIAAMGSTYLFYVLAQPVSNKKLRYAIIIILTSIMLAPNIIHVINYKVPTVFSKPEVASLDKLSKIGSDKDYVITWWDYGYPMWFYSNKNTLIDGGKHHHDNFIVSEILLTTSQLEAARLSRIAVETYVDSNYSIVADTLFKNKQPDQVDVSAYLENLRYGDVSLPKKNREIYLYLPLRMISIFPTVSVFSNLDLATGQTKKQPFMFQSRQLQKVGNMLNLGNNVRIDLQHGTVLLGNQTIPTNTFYTTDYDKNGKLVVTKQVSNPQAPLSIIYMRSSGQFLIVDQNILHSTFIQMFVLEQYDHNLFEAVELTPLVKVFRVKI